MLDLSAMYRETHFMHARDLVEYAKSQATSCVFLCDEYERLMEGPNVSKPLAVAERYLRKVHQRQYDDLLFVMGPGVEIPMVHDSYYLRCMRNSGAYPLVVSYEWAVRLVMYERGRLRYEQLVRETKDLCPEMWPVWNNFHRDATLNREVCLAWLEAHTRWSHHIDEMVERVIRHEQVVMARIDAKNKGK